MNTDFQSSKYVFDVYIMSTDMIKLLHFCIGESQSWVWRFMVPILTVTITFVAKFIIDYALLHYFSKYNSK